MVNPDDVVEKYGADTVRLYEMFMGPLERDKPWTDEGVQGVNRFLKRVWSLLTNEDGSLSPRIQDGGGSDALKKVLHHTIKAVGEDIEGLRFNTAISRMMEFVNAAMKEDVLDRAWAEQFVLTLAPFAPHLSEEVWSKLGHAETLAYESWPEYDASLLVEDTIEVPIQFNGKVRSRVVVAKDASKEALLEAARLDEAVQRNLEGKTLVKEIAVPGRMVNFVVK